MFILNLSQLHQITQTQRLQQNSKDAGPLVRYVAEPPRESNQPSISQL